MELDSRIIEGKRPLTCFDTEQAKQFLGKECYFSDHLCTFNELLDAYSYVTADMLVSKEKHLYVGELLTVSDSDGSCYEAGINGEAEWFQFCLPCEWVKKPEKKYRAFTIKEFQQKYSVGSVLKIRQKQNRFTESVVQYVGYKVYEDRIYLGITDFTLDELFENFEMIEPQSDTWHPFGVIDEDKE